MKRACTSKMNFALRCSPVTPTDRETTIPSSLPRCVAPTSSPCSPPFCAQLPMWPSTIGQLARKLGCLADDGMHALESIMARICRETGGRVRANSVVRDWTSGPRWVAVDEMCPATWNRGERRCGTPSGTQEEREHLS